MAYKIIGKKKYEIQKLTKRIYKTQVYFMADLFEDFHGGSWFEEVSNETRAVYETFLKCIYSDVGHLKCDEFTGEYIVEQGFNKLGVVD